MQSKKSRHVPQQIEIPTLAFCELCNLQQKQARKKKHAQKSA